MGEAPRSERFDDVYFSAHDGPGETAHVFLDGNNLPGAWQGRRRFTIGETGFGTGLNFLLAWELFDRTAPAGAFLDFISVEKFPLSPAEIRAGLAPWGERLGPYLEKLVSQYPLRIPGFHRMVFDRRVALTLIFDDANDALPQMRGQVDAWFLDGFTPSKNPDMWTDTVFRAMARLSHGQTSFATFTAAGFVRRGLEAAGFEVRKAKGFGPKRDMLVGRFTGPETAAALPAQAGAVSVLGGGLAGCATAHILRDYGYAPRLHDPNGVATGASGNRAGLANPRIAAARSPEWEFYASGYALAARTFPALSGGEGVSHGALHLLNTDARAKRFMKASDALGWGSEMRLLDARDASDACAARLGHAALLLPSALRVDPFTLCHRYVEGVEIAAMPDPTLPTIHATPATIPGLPLQTVRGQITYAAASPASAKLEASLCYGGYISAPDDNIHAVGATFQKWFTDTGLRDEDDARNLAALAEAVPALSGLKPVGARAALRTATPDRFPVIGPFEGGLVATGYGSHGIVGSIAGAHLIADYLRGGPFSLPEQTLGRLDPRRFQVRKA